MSLLKVAGTTASSGQLYVDDVFSTYLYTGNNSTQTITNGIDLAGKGGLVWLKPRAIAVGSHALFDSNRGTNNYIASQSTNAQSAVSGPTFTSTGFILNGSWNGSPETYVSWTFRKAAKFFDVVTYTGTGSARTIAHSLGVAPGMVIVKRTDTTGDWQVYSNGLTSAAYSIQLNLTAAQASAPTVWNSTAPTSSVFSVGTDATVNASGGTYVAYLFAHDTSSTGIIQCGTFTTNAFPGNATVNLGWEPQYLMIKPSSGVGPWRVIDTMRGISLNGNDAVLFPNLVDAETLMGTASINATGFISDDGSGSTTYIYMAIRRPNKPPTSGTQVFSPVKQAGGGTVTTGFPVDLSINTKPSSVFDRYCIDRLRGVSKTTFPYLVTDATGAEVAGSGYGLGFDNNTGYIDNGVYGSGETPIYWNFKRAPGFFDEVCYTGTGVARTVAHNLGVAPEMMIVKRRDSLGGWLVYNIIGTATKYLTLGSQSGFTTSSVIWNNTEPTISVFSVGTNASVNASGGTYVAYLFATLAGISKVGSYTGNGTGQAIACGFSAGARFVLIKRTDSNGDWYTFDSARGLTSTSSPYSLLNSTAAETTGNNGVYASTGGFTLGSTASTTTNISGASYIFLSVA